MYFGEMTFNPESGLFNTYPDSDADYNVGRMWSIECPQVSLK